MAGQPDNLSATDSMTNVSKKNMAKKAKMDSFSNFAEHLTALFEFQPIAEASPEIQNLLAKMKQLVMTQQSCIDTLIRKWKQADEKLARVEEKWKKELKEARDSCEILDRSNSSYLETVTAKDAEIAQLKSQLAELQQVVQIKLQKSGKYSEQLDSINVHLPVQESNELSRDNAFDPSGLSALNRQGSEVLATAESYAEAAAELDRAAAEHFVRYDLEAAKGELQKCKAELKEICSERDRLKIQVDQLLEAQKRNDKEVLDALDKTIPQQTRNEESVTDADVTALYSLINITHRFLGIACAQNMAVSLTNPTAQLANMTNSAFLPTRIDAGSMPAEIAVSHLSSRISAKGSLVSSQIQTLSTQLNQTTQVGRTAVNQPSDASLTNGNQSEHTAENRDPEPSNQNLNQAEEHDEGLSSVVGSRVEVTSMMDLEMLKEALTKLNEKYNAKKYEIKKLKDQLLESASLQESLEEAFKEREDYMSLFDGKNKECDDLKKKMRRLTDDLNKARSAADEYKQNMAQQISSYQQQLYKAVEESQRLRQEVQQNKNVKLELERVKSDLRQVSASTNLTTAQIAGLAKTTRDSMGLTSTQQSSANTGVDLSKAPSKKPSPNH